ncbi:MAG TPA: hypothetical protein VFV72_16305 [Candidatus Limnocylindrales bacterium]|nr:hypothetical protein [Candidatus Limnocylindrales bacterium]
MTQRPRQQPQSPTRWQRIRTWFGRLVNVLGIALLVLVAVALIGATVEHFAQSGSAPVTIVGMKPATWTHAGGPRGGEVTESGQAITYEFTVDGQTFLDTENRTWLDVRAARPKVCYDPANPQKSHFLAQEAYTCGGWNPLQDYGQFGWSSDGSK